MKEPTKVNAKISAGGQPSEEDIAALKASGVRKIINLRRAGEANQPLDPSEGPVYVHCAAGGRAVTHALLAEANTQGNSAETVFKKAESIGAPVTDEGFKAFIRTVAGDGKK
jgi:protein tyrosine phosphatase (PTP) superfamily phosphohydrolase (DUF442 family)